MVSTHPHKFFVVPVLYIQTVFILVQVFSIWQFLPPPQCNGLLVDLHS